MVDRPVAGLVYCYVLEGLVEVLEWQEVSDDEGGGGGDVLQEVVCAVVVASIRRQAELPVVVDSMWVVRKHMAVVPSA
jgi:hypothetical protein